jgi:hypothetical protein
MLYGIVRLFGTLLVNAIPLIGVIWFGWSVFEVLLLYWFENVAIGVAHAARMAISTRTNAAATGWATTVFFMLHYGLFTFVHGVFVLVFFGIVAGGLAEIGPGFLGPVLAISGWQVAFLFIDAASSERFKDRTPEVMMFEPYPRVVALHLTVLAGGWAILELGAPVWALVVLVGVKTLFDLGVAWFDSRRTDSPAGTFAALRKRRD